MLVVRYRVVDHKDSDQSPEGRKTNHLFKAYVVDGERFDNVHSLMLGVEKVCKAISGA